MKTIEEVNIFIRITNFDRLRWIVENFIEHKPSGYNGCDYARFDGHLKTDEANFIKAVDAEIAKERSNK